MAGGGMLKSLTPKVRLQATEIQSLAFWGAAAGAGAIYLVQPFNWIRKTFFEKEAGEGK
ncbi:unnamed protein product [Linum tenue]|uniref:Ubiquinol-cytochrome c reductase complex 6.7 kDa protein n=1 Tax=Linum tenue TaxID=586396 RepID=A0AAV0NL65_9ROSI|nr:unnamed protein product [Linum tenue]